MRPNPTRSGAAVAEMVKSALVADLTGVIQQDLDAEPAAEASTGAAAAPRPSRTAATRKKKEKKGWQHNPAEDPTELVGKPVRARPGRLGALRVAIVDQFCTALLHGREGQLTAQNRRFRRGQVREYWRQAAAVDDETVRALAARVGCDERALVALNQRRWYPELSLASKLKEGTPMMVPTAEGGADFVEGGVVATDNAGWWRCDFHNGCTADLEEREVRHRVRSRCRFVLPRIHFMRYSLTCSVPLYLKRRCDRTLGQARHLAAPLCRGRMGNG